MKISSQCSSDVGGRGKYANRFSRDDGGRGKYASRCSCDVGGRGKYAILNLTIAKLDGSPTPTTITV